MEAEFELSTAFSVESIFIYVSLIGSPATLSQALELLPFPAGIELYSFIDQLFYRSIENSF